MKKSILITGCSSGIGFEAAKMLHERGYRVFATVRQEKDISALTNLGITCYPLDVTNPQSIDTALQKIMNEVEILDIVFNNAGYMQPGAIEDITPAAFHAQMDANTLGFINVVRAVLPILRKQNHGHIIQTGSVLGIFTMPFRGLYGASKFALEALADALRLELHNTNIHVSLLEPGPVKSALRDKAKSHFETHINKNNSAHKNTYNTMNRQFFEENKKEDYAVSAEKAVKQLIKLIEASSPKFRIYTDWRTRTLVHLRHFLPDRWFHAIMTLIIKEELQ